MTGNVRIVVAKKSDSICPEQGCTTCGLRWKFMRSCKCYLRRTVSYGSRVLIKTICLWVKLLSRKRPNRRVEAEQKRCKKWKYLELTGARKSYKQT